MKIFGKSQKMNIGEIINKKMIHLVLYICFILIFNSCGFLGLNSGPLELVVNEDSFALSWDSQNVKSVGKTEDNHIFRIYYRVHGTIEWIYLSDSPYLNNPEFTINKSILDPGIYDFAVSFIDQNGIESKLHSSLESTASPMTGWYINWY